MMGMFCFLSKCPEERVDQIIVETAAAQGEVAFAAGMIPRHKEAFDALPDELKQRRQWVVWRLEHRTGRPTKIPYQPNGSRSETNNRETWCSFDEAKACFDTGEYNGIGFVFSDDDPYVGVDLDKCRDPDTGVIESWALDVVNELQSYTELSQSGCGLHVIVRSEVQFGGRRCSVEKGNLEIYSSVRYFVMTGRHLPGTPGTVEDRTNEITILYQHLFPSKVKAARGARKQPKVNTADGVEENFGRSFAPAPMSYRLAGADDETILDRARKAANGDKFRCLFDEGNTSDYDNDHSSADYALCRLLTFWTRDLEQIDRLFRRSRLMREKWDRNSGNSTYGQRTIMKALSEATNNAVFHPSVSDLAVAKPDRMLAYSDLLMALSFTDVGNAKRLVARHGKNIRYCFAWDKWLVWDRKRWVKDAGDRLPRLAKEMIAEFRIAGLSNKDATRHALFSEKDSSIRAMIAQARSEDGVPVKVDELDANKMILNCLNGTVDLRDGQLKPHDRSQLITKLAPVAYDANAECPEFFKFLTRIMAGNETLTAYLQRIFGYALTGSVSEKAMFFFDGEGDNGKTTLLEAIRFILGDYAGQIPIESLLKKTGDGIPNDIAQLRGLRFVTTSESESDKKLAEAKVKQLTGMGTVQARFMYGEYFEFEPTFKIFMDSNHKPVIRGTERAIWSRTKLVPFPVTIPVEERDPNLRQKLIAEAPGILAWAVQGCLAWQRDGLGEPSEVRAATAEYRDEMDIVKRFIDEVCVLESDAKTVNSTLWKGFEVWCSENHLEPLTHQNFFNRLARFPGIQRCKVGGIRGGAGIRLKQTGGSAESMIQERAQFVEV